MTHLQCCCVPPDGSGLRPNTKYQILNTRYLNHPQAVKLPIPHPLIVTSHPFPIPNAKNHYQRPLFIRHPRQIDGQIRYIRTPNLVPRTFPAPPLPARIILPHDRILRCIPSRNTCHKRKPICTPRRQQIHPRIKCRHFNFVSPSHSIQYYLHFASIHRRKVTCEWTITIKIKPIQKCTHRRRIQLALSTSAHWIRPNTSQQLRCHLPAISLTQ